MNFKNYSRVMGDNIRLYREQKELSQKDIAEKIKISRQHISRIECGSANPTLEILYLLSEALEVPVSAFLGDYPIKIESLIKKYKFSEKNDIFKLLTALDTLDKNQIDMFVKMIIGLKK